MCEISAAPSEIRMEKRIPGGRMRYYRVLLLMTPLVMVLLSGCLGWGTSDSTKHSPETTMQNEVAELVKIYRLCLQKYEENAEKAKEHCAIYKEAIREIAPERQKSIVAELLDRLRDKTH